MKVENIKTNYVGNRYGQNKPLKPAFTGSPVRGAEEILTEILPNRKALKFINKFESWRGELGGILITAIGTGLVAPFSIAFNPFVKPKADATEEEKKELSNTKKYTAMRQPISAVLAALFQAGALKPIDHFLDTISNNPEYSKHFWLELDQGAVQKKEYLERLIKKEMKQNPQYSGLSKKDFKAKLDELVKEKQNSQIEKVAESLGETGRIKIGERYLADKEVADYINSTIDDYIDDAKALKYDEKGLAFYTNRATVLMENKEAINNILSREKLEEFKGKPRELKTYLLGLRDKPENIGFQKILDEIIEAPDQLRESRCFRTVDRIRRIEAALIGTGEFKPENYTAVLAKRNTVLDMKIVKLLRAKIADPAKATTADIKAALEELTQLCHYDARSSEARDIYENTNTFQNNIEKLGAKIKKDIAKRYKKVMENRYKGFSQITKVAIGVCITLPITCSVLNWVYPRFMDIFFPNLAGKTKGVQEAKNGGDK